jgi:hypothetical protein
MQRQVARLGVSVAKHWSTFCDKLPGERMIIPYYSAGNQVFSCSESCLLAALQLAKLYH